MKSNFFLTLCWKLECNEGIFSGAEMNRKQMSGIRPKQLKSLGCIQEKIDLALTGKNRGERSRGKRGKMTKS